MSSPVDKKAKQHLRKNFGNGNEDDKVHVIDIKDGAVESPWNFATSMYELFQAFLEEREPNTVGRISCGCVGMPFETLVGPKKSIRKKLRQDLMKRMEESKTKKSNKKEEEQQEDGDEEDLLK